jgi:hypothetical protein
MKKLYSRLHKIGDVSMVNSPHLIKLYNLSHFVILCFPEYQEFCIEIPHL